MQFTSALAGGRRSVGAAALPVGAVMSVLLMTTVPLAHLVSHFHVSTGTAGMIITAVTGSSWMIAVFFPWVLPYVLTIRGLLLAIGTGATIGW